MALQIINGLPRSPEYRVFRPDELRQARHENGFMLSGLNPQLVLSMMEKPLNPVAFLEYVYSTGSFDLQAADGTALLSGLPSGFGDAYSPIRLDWGLRLVGTILAAKGFVIF